LTPHLALLFSSFAAFCLPSAAFMQRKQYGPLVREVDTAMDGRVEGWEMLRLVLDTVDMNSRWYNDDVSAPGAAAERDVVVSNMLDSIKAGLEDEVEVQVPVLPVLGCVLGCLPLQAVHVLQLVSLLQGRLDSVVRADAVGSEVTQHEEMMQAALRAGKAIQAALEEDRKLSSVGDSSEWKRLEASMQRRQLSSQPAPGH